MRPLREDEVEWHVLCLPEDIPIRGNASASGDRAFDAQVEADILKQLDSGNDWAWCCVRVVGTWRGMEADDHLGCSSYESEEDFKVAGYFEDMKRSVLHKLNAQIRAVDDALDTLRGP
jgi:hypothetical protein